MADNKAESSPRKHETSGAQLGSGRASAQHPHETSFTKNKEEGKNYARSKYIEQSVQQSVIPTKLTQVNDYNSLAPSKEVAYMDVNEYPSYLNSVVM